ncbi:MAG: exodeoxyribonuclease VII small subunit [Planctomycetia bacterium]|nr:exodeoxyribonuclease VII small subunit [Planctomycetia bacterium]
MSKDISFEDSMRRLDTIASQLDSGKLDLQTSLQLYEEGISLIRKCHSILENARQKIAVLKSWDENGTPIAEEVDPEQFRSDKSVPGKKSSSVKTPDQKEAEEVLEKHSLEEIALYSR